MKLVVLDELCTKEHRTWTGEIVKIGINPAQIDCVEEIKMREHLTPCSKVIFFTKMSARDVYCEGSVEEIVIKINESLK